MSRNALFLSALWLLFGLPLSGCDDKDTAGPRFSAELDEQGCNIIHVDEPLSDPNFSINIDSAWVEGSNLHLAVSTGGCSFEAEDAALIWDGSVMESYPTQVRLQLHDQRNQGDVTCMMMIFDTLCYRAEGLLAAAGDRTTLHLEASETYSLSVE